jgi:hypothetical protein
MLKVARGYRTAGKNIYLIIETDIKTNKFVSLIVFGVNIKRLVLFISVTFVPCNNLSLKVSTFSTQTHV